MVCPDNAQIRSQLETTYRKSASTPLRQQLRHFLRQVGSAIVDGLTRDYNQPRISKFYNIEGQAIWHVYDPAAQTGATLRSELEVREWLERHYLD
ncbi:MAG: hypothetical protein AAFQ89_14270 [Cyanobacteria bacterium J06626_18]